MPTVTGPAFSLDAKGTLGKTLTFQKKGKGHTVYPYKKPGDREPFTPSPSQNEQRDRIRAVVAEWQGLSDAEKASWDEKAENASFPGTGYHYYLHLYGSKDAAFVDYIFSDGFESGDFTAWGWTDEDGNSVLEVVSTRAREGTYSMRTLPEQDEATVDVGKDTGHDGLVVHTRFFLYIPEDMVMQGDGYISIMAYNTAGWQASTELHLSPDYDGTPKLGVIRRDSGGSSHYYWPVLPLRQGYWNYIEVRSVIDDTNGEIIIWLNDEDTPVYELTGVDTGDTAIPILKIGELWTKNNRDEAMFWDSIIYHNKKIGDIN